MEIERVAEVSVYQRLLQISYKKLKSSVFFDKTQLILRDKLVNEENRIEGVIDRLAKQIAEGNLSDTIKTALNTISVLTFPKKMMQEREDPSRLISNLDVQAPCVSELQYFCDMSVEGYILGVTWLLVVGHRLDDAIYEHSYGNRLRKNLLDKETGRPTFSPYLFEPYFQQYEGWRDRALSFAQKTLAKGQDVVLLTLDFKRFYYQVDLSLAHLQEVVRELAFESEQELPQEYRSLVDPLTEFVWKAADTYSDKLRERNPRLVANRCVLPIGFPPSNVLANYCLKSFDDVLINGWNPLYYGRYVDDIIIVDKVEKNSTIYRAAQEGKLTSEAMIQYYLQNCSSWHRGNASCSNNDRNGLLILDGVETQRENQKRKNKGKPENAVVYMVNPMFTEFKDSRLIVQNEKIKLFYFDSKQSDALLTCFQKGLRENKSEFRFLPEDEPVFQNDDYSEIYEFSEKDGPNKLRGVEGIRLDRFRLSKFLGKYMRIGGLVQDHKESQFVADIDRIFTPADLIEQYISWEKVLSILANNGNFEAYGRFIEKVWKAVESLATSEYRPSIPEEKSTQTQELQGSLRAFLFSAIHKTLALVWGVSGKDVVETLTKRVFQNDPVTQIHLCTNIDMMRRKYCETRMCDKYAIPLPIDGYVGRLSELSRSDKAWNLTLFQDALNAGYISDCLDKADYKYYPYLITMSDLSLYYIVRQLYSLRTNKLYRKTTADAHKDLYAALNYRISAAESTKATPLCIKEYGRRLAIRVGEEKRGILPSRLPTLSYPQKPLKRYFAVCRTAVTGGISRR